jgi:hypothetical protein
MKDSKAVPFGSSVGQNKLSVPIGSPTQLGESIGEKYRITLKIEEICSSEMFG